MKKEEFHTIKMFLKFGSQDNIEDLYNNGTVFLNTIEYFRKQEDNELRGDKYEGASKIINSLLGTFRIPNVDKDFRYEKVHLRKSYQTLLGNLYCLYCISSFAFPNPLDFKIDERNLRFGTHCLMIKDNKYFLDSIEKELVNKGLEFYHGFVNYYDKETICKDLTLFDKPSEFEYQKEFRFYVHNNKLKPIKLRIGSLHDKAEIYTMKEIMTLKLEPKRKN